MRGEFSLVVSEYGRIRPLCALTVSQKITENVTVEFKSDFPLRKIIRSTLVATNSSYVINGTLLPHYTRNDISPLFFERNNELGLILSIDKQRENIYLSVCACMCVV